MATPILSFPCANAKSASPLLTGRVKCETLVRAADNIKRPDPIALVMPFESYSRKVRLHCLCSSGQGLGIGFLIECVVFGCLPPSRGIYFMNTALRLMVPNRAASVPGGFGRELRITAWWTQKIRTMIPKLRL